MLSLADPALMSLKRAQRVQAFEPDGRETAAPDTRWAFMAKANVTDKQPTAEEAEEQGPADKPILPWRALEAIQTAKVLWALSKLSLPCVAVLRRVKPVSPSQMTKCSLECRARWMSSWTLCRLCGNRCSSSASESHTDHAYAL
jgi:hypothetical protein